MPKCCAKAAQAATTGRQEQIAPRGSARMREVSMRRKANEDAAGLGLGEWADSGGTCDSVRPCK